MNRLLGNKRCSGSIGNGGVCLLVFTLLTARISSSGRKGVSILDYALLCINELFTRSINSLEIPTHGFHWNADKFKGLSYGVEG